MGLMDLAGQFMGGSQSGGDTKTQLLNAVIGLIQNHPGGIQGLLSQFQSSGLGAHVASWVGPGENMPISGEQLQQALGNEQVQALAQQAGIPAEHATSGLAELLPGIIHHLSPGGSVPEGHDIQQGLGGLLGKFLG